MGTSRANSTAFARNAHARVGPSGATANLSFPPGAPFSRWQNEKGEENGSLIVDNVNELFVAIARRLPKNTPQPRPGGTGGLTINTDAAGSGKKGCC